MINITYIKMTFKHIDLHIRHIDSSTFRDLISIDIKIWGGAICRGGGEPWCGGRAWRRGGGPWWWGGGRTWGGTWEGWGALVGGEAWGGGGELGGGWWEGAYTGAS